MLLLESVQAYATDALRNAMNGAKDLLSSSASTKTLPTQQTGIASACPAHGNSHAITHAIFQQHPSSITPGSTYSTVTLVLPHLQCGDPVQLASATTSLVTPPSRPSYWTSSRASPCCGISSNKDIVVISDDSGEEEEVKCDIPSRRAVVPQHRAVSTGRGSGSKNEVDELDDSSSSSDSEVAFLSSQLSRPSVSTPSTKNEVADRPVWEASFSPAQVPRRRRAKTVSAPKPSSQSRPDSPPRTEVYHCGTCSEQRLENVAAVILHLEQVHQSQFDNGADIVCTTCVRRQPPMTKSGFIAHIRLRGEHIKPSSPGQSFGFVLQYQPIAITGGSSSPNDATIRESTDPSSGSSSSRLPATPSASEKKRKRLNLESASSSSPQKRKTGKGSKGKGKGKSPAPQ